MDKARAHWFEPGENVEWYLLGFLCLVVLSRFFCNGLQVMSMRMFNRLVIIVSIRRQRRRTWCVEVLSPKCDFDSPVAMKCRSMHHPSVLVYPVSHLRLHVASPCRDRRRMDQWPSAQLTRLIAARRVRKARFCRSDGPARKTPRPFKKKSLRLLPYF